jgi:hypothetical protein
MIKHLLTICLLLLTYSADAQKLRQYFDGEDTSANNGLKIYFDTRPGNIWQIGRPQKTIFDSAATLPNALVTDTLNTYPVTDTSRFYFGLKNFYRYGVFAIQWKQKIDMDKKYDGGMIEFSTDKGVTWQNVFNNPLVYKFYGFDTTSRDTLHTGEYAFSGTDSTWRDIWLCFDNSFLTTLDTVAVRFTLLSDGVDSMKEGWLIDNMLAHITYQHTVADKKQLHYLNVYPTKTTGIVHIEAEKKQEFHIIEKLIVRDAAGRVLQSYSNLPTKYWVDLSDKPDGTYYLEIQTNFKKQTFPIIVNK